MSLADKLISSPDFESYATSGALVSNVTFETARGPCRAIRIGTGGDLTVTRARDGASVTIPSLVAGETIMIQALAIISATTTAQKITVLW